MGRARGRRQSLHRVGHKLTNKRQEETRFMPNNKVKQIWASGKAVVNGWLEIPSGFSAEMIAQCGFDSVTVDMQHGVQDYHSMVQCFQSMDKHPVTPMVRVPWNEPGIVGKVLDGGAWGIICPMVNNVAEAKALVSYALYPPKGKRSNGPIRAGAYGSATPYQRTANDEVLIIPMIETQEGNDKNHPTPHRAGARG